MQAGDRIGVNKKRNVELDTIFKHLYEDSVLGRITAEQFQSLSASYMVELQQLKADIPEKEAVILKLRHMVSSTDNFVAKVKRYTDITDLTPELLRLFVHKIVIHEKESKSSKQSQQTVEIHYKDVGVVDAAVSEKI